MTIAVGMLVNITVLRHNLLMVEYVDQDEFGEMPPLALPNEKRREYLAGGAVVLGAVSFVALLLLP